MIRVEWDMPGRRGPVTGTVDVPDVDGAVTAVRRAVWAVSGDRPGEAEALLARALVLALQSNAELELAVNGWWKLSRAGYTVLLTALP